MTPSCAPWKAKFCVCFLGSGVPWPRVWAMTTTGCPWARPAHFLALHLLIFPMKGLDSIALDPQGHDTLRRGHKTASPPQHRTPWAGPEEPAVRPDQRSKSHLSTWSTESTVPDSHPIKQNPQPSPQHNSASVINCYVSVSPTRVGTLSVSFTTCLQHGAQHGAHRHLSLASSPHQGASGRSPRHLKTQREDGVFRTAAQARAQTPPTPGALRSLWGTSCAVGAGSGVGQASSRSHT